MDGGGYILLFTHNDACFRDNMKSVFLQAVVLSLSQSMVFYFYSAGFSFGAFLVIENRAVYDDLIQ